MPADNFNREYLTLNPEEGYPIGSDLFYECLTCNETVPSMPRGNAHCKCRNIMLDVDFGRISIRDNSKIKLFRAKV